MRRLLFALWLPLAAQVPQNPSPIKDSTRTHQRVPQAQPSGERYPLSLGSLFLAGPRRGAIPIVVHFHGDPWLAETSALRRSRQVAVLAVNLGSSPEFWIRLKAKYDLKKAAQDKKVMARVLRIVPVKPVREVHA